MTSPADDSVAALDALLNQLNGATSAPAADATGSAATSDHQAPGSDDVELLYDDVAQFVDEYLRHVVERRVAAGSGTGVFWCTRWWAHPEALSRIYALWRAWEVLRVTDPATGMSVWWRDHLDPHLAQLTSEYGPFGRCQPASDGRPARHHEPQPLPGDPMPAEVRRQFPEGK